MREHKPIILAAMGYAAFFTLFTDWWTGGLTAMLVLFGAASGVIWYWLFSRGTRWVIGRRK